MLRDFIGKNLENRNPPHDSDVVDQYINNPKFVEKEIITYIFNMEGLDLDMEYLPLYGRQMNAADKKAGEDSIIYMDELLTYTTLSFFLTIYSYVYDNSDENTNRCVKNMYSFLEIQGNHHAIAVHSISEILEMITLPKNIVDLAADTFWTAWTFIIGHELFHLMVNEKMSVLQEEYNADTYGYQILLRMMEEQKKGKIPENIRIYYEYLYLSPVMLFACFEVLDEYRSMKGSKINYLDHPSPEDRQKHIFEMFDTDVLDDFDTT